VDLASSDGRHLNPGHGLEAMWFLMRHAEATGDRAMVERCARIVPRLLERGWDPVHGGIFYFRDALGKPHAELTADMKLWWVHDEAILATLYAYRLTGERQFLDWFRKIDAWTWARFPDPAYGEWFGYLDRRGEPANLLKGGRWKTFFHVPRCLLFAVAQMRACDGGAAPLTARDG
jgi:N-acylglucosamine 2-epimerase